MKKAIMPYILKAISSDQARNAKRHLGAMKRKWTGEKPCLEVFIKANDPYSYLLVQALSSIESRFDVALKYHVFQDINPDMYPRLDLLHTYAQQDALYLARLYDYHFPAPDEVPEPSPQLDGQLAHALVSIENDPDFLEKADSLLYNYWFKQEAPQNPGMTPSQCDQRLAQNQSLLSQKGHYLGAVLYFEGEWYWGVDRLDHLEQRLIELQFAKHPSETTLFNRTYKEFCQKPGPSSPAANPKPLTLFWSARSPYSYIGLEKAVWMAEHYQLPLKIKPVLPMVMRGMQVPDAKKLYIFLDTKREAQKIGLPYGCVADPLGAAVERCYALVDYAISENKLQDFLLSFARGVNAEGIRAETDRGLKTIVTRCGLDWTIAKQKLGDQDWRAWAKNNLDEMLSLGCWGVPTICYDETHAWGQDRFGLLEQQIRKSLRLD